MTGDQVVAVLLLLAAYGTVSWVWPLRRCRSCKGTGRSRSPTGKAWRKCGRCAGSGDRLRAGARLLGRRR